MLSLRTDGHHPVGWVAVRRIGNLLVQCFIYQPGIRENGTGFIKAVKACKRITQIEASYPYPQEQQECNSEMSDGSSPSTATNAEGRAECNPGK